MESALPTTPYPESKEFTEEEKEKVAFFHQSFRTMKESTPRGLTSMMQHNREGHLAYAYLAVVQQSQDFAGKRAWRYYVDPMWRYQLDSEGPRGEDPDDSSESNPLVYHCRFGACLRSVVCNASIGEKVVHIFKIPLSLFGTTEDTMLYNPFFSGCDLRQMFARLRLSSRVATPHIQAKYADEECHDRIEAYIKKKEKELLAACELLYTYWRTKKEDGPTIYDFLWQHRVRLNPAIAGVNLHTLGRCREMLFPAANLGHLLRTTPSMTVSGDILELINRGVDFFGMDQQTTK